MQNEVLFLRHCKQYAESMKRLYWVLFSYFSIVGMDRSPYVDPRLIEYYEKRIDQLKAIYPTYADEYKEDVLQEIRETTYLLEAYRSKQRKIMQKVVFTPSHDDESDEEFDCCWCCCS